MTPPRAVAERVKREIGYHQALHGTKDSDNALIHDQDEEATYADLLLLADAVLAGEGAGTGELKFRRSGDGVSIDDERGKLAAYIAPQDFDKLRSLLATPATTEDTK